MKHLLISAVFLFASLASLADVTTKRYSVIDFGELLPIKESTTYGAEIKIDEVDVNNRILHIYSLKQPKKPLEMAQITLQKDSPTDLKFKITKVFQVAPNALKSLFFQMGASVTIPNEQKQNNAKPLKLIHQRTGVTSVREVNLVPVLK